MHILYRGVQRVGFGGAIARTLSAPGVAPTLSAQPPAVLGGTSGCLVNLGHPRYPNLWGDKPQVSKYPLHVPDYIITTLSLKQLYR